MFLGFPIEAVTGRNASLDEDAPGAGKIKIQHGSMAKGKT